VQHHCLATMCGNQCTHRCKRAAQQPRNYSQGLDWFASLQRPLQPPFPGEIGAAARPGPTCLAHTCSQGASNPGPHPPAAGAGCLGHASSSWPLPVGCAAAEHHPLLSFTGRLQHHMHWPLAQPSKSLATGPSRCTGWRAAWELRLDSCLATVQQALEREATGTRRCHHRQPGAPPPQGSPLRAHTRTHRTARPSARAAHIGARAAGGGTHALGPAAPRGSTAAGAAATRAPWPVDGPSTMQVRAVACPLPQNTAAARGMARLHA
jgi:hypothetical protein